MSFCFGRVGGGDDEEDGGCMYGGDGYEKDDNG